VSVIIKRPWTTQPQVVPQIDWSNPLTSQLVFCAVPVGSQFIDLVTGVFGTPNGTVASAVRGSNGGASRRGDGRAINGNNGTGDYFDWPVSLSRGGNVTTAGTILALGGVTTQVDAQSYPIGGNTEAVTLGDGFALRIDSFDSSGRGNIIRGRYLNNAGTSATELLGNPFSNKTFFFGYSYTGNGSDGTWLSSGSGVTWTGGATFGTTTTNRKAYVGTSSSADTKAKPWYVLQLLMFSRVISVAEYRSLYDNPWQLFAPLPRRIWAPAAGAPGAALDGDSSWWPMESQTNPLTVSVW
jgi:hypothetical protein